MQWLIRFDNFVLLEIFQPCADLIGRLTGKSGFFLAAVCFAVSSTTLYSLESALRGKAVPVDPGFIFMGLMGFGSLYLEVAPAVLTDAFRRKMENAFVKCGRALITLASLPLVPMFLWNEKPRLLLVPMVTMIAGNYFLGCTRKPISNLKMFVAKQNA